jgi:hypothetical protein
MDIVLYKDHRLRWGWRLLAWLVLMLVLLLGPCRFLAKQIDRRRGIQYIHADAVVEQYKTYFEDTVLDFNACYEVTFFIPSARINMDYSYCTLVGTAECSLINIWHWLGWSDDCIHSRTPNLVKGDVVTVRYDPKNNAIVDWMRQP